MYLSEHYNQPVNASPQQVLMLIRSMMLGQNLCLRCRQPQRPPPQQRCWQQQLRPQQQQWQTQQQWRNNHDDANNDSDNNTKCFLSRVAQNFQTVRRRQKRFGIWQLEVWMGRGCLNRSNFLQRSLLQLKLPKMNTVTKMPKLKRKNNCLPGCTKGRLGQSYCHKCPTTVCSGYKCHSQGGLNCSLLLQPG